MNQSRQAQKTQTIALIRKHYADLGIPLDELSDQQIELGVRQLASAAKEAGTGTEAANQAMREAVEIVKRQKAEAQAAADAAAAESEEERPG